MILLKDILNEQLQESVSDKGIFKLIFFAGLPGSGKSYVTQKITDGSISPRVVNTDTFIELLSKQLGRDINLDVDYSKFEPKIKNLTVNQLANYINSALPLFVDGTSNSMSSLFRREGIMKGFGYDTGMIWINTDLNTAISRAKQRDRHVPEEFIKKVHDNLSENKKYYESHFSYFKEINNSEGELTDKAIILAYNSVRDFFNSPVENPLGKRNINLMQKSNGYMIPTLYPSLSVIKNQLRGWYTKKF